MGGNIVPPIIAKRNIVNYLIFALPWLETRSSFTTPEALQIRKKKENGTVESLGTIEN
jgi:hypothetical protein